LNLLRLQLKESKGYMKLQQQSAVSSQPDEDHPACWEECREGPIHAGYVSAPMLGYIDQQPA
jgi:hypothetical protein